MKRKAAERLAELVDPALTVLMDSMIQDKDMRLRLQAAIDALDRNNLSGKQKIEVTEGWADQWRRKRAALSENKEPKATVAEPQIEGNTGESGPEQ